MRPRVPEAVRRAGGLLTARGGTRLNVILLLVYLGVTAAGVAHHEPFRDEARRWLVARDTASLSELVRQAPYEGPVLWHLLLRVPARMGMPYATMAWMNWAVAGGAAGLLLLAGPLPAAFKIGALFSHVMLHEYPVPARYYALTVCLLFAALALYPKRREHPKLLGVAVLLLANSSVIGAIFAAPVVVLLGAELVRGRDRARPLRAPVLLGSIGMVLLLGQVIQPGGGGNATFQQAMAQPWAPSQIVRSAYFGFFAGSGLLPMAGLPARPLLGWTALGLLAAVLAAVRGRRRALLVYGFSLAALMVIYSRMGSSPRHGGFLLIAVVAALWMAATEADEGEPSAARPGSPGVRTWVFALSTILLCAGFPGSALIFGRDWKEPFSGAREMGRFLVANHLEGVPIAAHRPDNAASVLPYLPAGTKLYYPALDAFRAYAGQDRPLLAQDGMSFELAAQRSFARFPGGARFLLLFSEGDYSSPDARCELLHVTRPAIIRDETYWLYDCRS